MKKRSKTIGIKDDGFTWSLRTVILWQGDKDYELLKKLNLLLNQHFLTIGDFVHQCAQQCVESNSIKIEYLTSRKIEHDQEVIEELKKARLKRWPSSGRRDLSDPFLKNELLFDQLYSQSEMTETEKYEKKQDEQNEQLDDDVKGGEI